MTRRTRGCLVALTAGMLAASGAAVPALAEPAATKPPTLSFSGLGSLKLGMTVAQARKADPSLKITTTGSGFTCTIATSRWAEHVYFNGPKAGRTPGRLVFIWPKKGIRTDKGLRAGDTYARAAQLYGFKQRTLDGYTWDYIRIRPSRRAANPVLGIEFPLGGKTGKNGRIDITQQRVSQLHLDNGQWCFN